MGFLHDIRQEWFAPSCVLCEAVSDNMLSLCTACQQDLPWLLHSCKTCALPLEDKSQATCISCQIQAPVLDHAICALHYSSPIDYLIKRMKFSRQLNHASVMGSILAQHLSQLNLSSVDAILPVPLHNARLRQRGFNQSLELAHAIRRYNDIPLLRGVQRVVNTKAQTLVKGEERAANIREAFAIDTKATLPRHVAIVDDVITTGATSNELARLLKSSGVSKVSVWAVARATTH